MTAAVDARALSVRELSEDGWLVRGTQDPHTALEAVLRLDTCAVQDLLADAMRTHRGDNPDDREWVARLGDLFHSLIADATPGHWRLVTSEALDADYEYRQAERPECGTFEGVLIR